MAFRFSKQFDAETAKVTLDFYLTLSEKDRRRFAAREAKRLGRGGVPYIADLLGCSCRTVERGLTELSGLSDDPALGRVRRPGAGRKKKIETEPGLEDNLNEMLQTRVAGDPDDADVIFTDLSAAQLADIATQNGTPVSDKTVDRWLADIGLGSRKMVKDVAGGSTPDREAQFLRIRELIDQYAFLGNPYFSIDTKAKEHLGRLYRAGRIRSTEPLHAFDHDFPSWADGVVIPHGIYDPVLNSGHINLGLSHDTSEFATESLRRYWQRIGMKNYPEATSILLLCDCGGSNAANRHLFKYYLQQLVDQIGIEIRVAHYPSYCSKYNPIERRLFPHIGRACSGMLFDSVQTVVKLMRRASTRTGLTTTVNVIKGMFEIGQKATAEIRSKLTTVFDELLPKWNYVTKPSTRH